jgi:hypothetical protein
MQGFIMIEDPGIGVKLIVIGCVRKALFFEIGGL